MEIRWYVKDKDGNEVFNFETEGDLPRIGDRVYMNRSCLMAKNREKFPDLNVLDESRVYYVENSYHSVHFGDQEARNIPNHEGFVGEERFNQIKSYLAEDGKKISNLGLSGVILWVKRYGEVILRAID